MDKKEFQRQFKCLRLLIWELDPRCFRGCPEDEYDNSIHRIQSLFHRKPDRGQFLAELDFWYPGEKAWTAKVWRALRDSRRD